jgi:CheY-like chemotaxis protein
MTKDEHVRSNPFFCYSWPKQAEREFMAKRILLADDSITIQKVVELTFSDGDYEVTAVNNGNKAIQKLSEMRPDIILSDIIMPEKNGYEVCEYVKSHPEFRTIPVILLTGTFEPFDPDRADKAGCDAVVTKPFESQSLIHKVEELIEHAKTQAPTAPGSPTPFAGDSPFAAESPAPSTPPADAFSTGTFQPHGEVFSGPSPSFSPPPTSETPFDQPPAAGETRAFPKMGFDDLKKMAGESSSTAPTPAMPQPSSPWDEPAPTTGETRAFPKMGFEDLAKPAPPTTDARPSSPWDTPAPTGGETRAFPRMSFENLDKAGSTPPPPPPSTPSWEAPSTTPPMTSSSPSLWDDQPSAPAGETKAFPKLSFDDFEKMAPPPPPPAPSMGAEESSFSRESKAPEEPKQKEAPLTPSSAASGSAGELSDEQIDRIARRVVQLMSETVIRNIAWEVIPDLAEMVVKERIRQLESE